MLVVAAAAQMAMELLLVALAQVAVALVVLAQPEVPHLRTQEVGVAVAETLWETLPLQAAQAAQALSLSNTQSLPQRL
jgi:hypothetical protein